MNEVIVIGGGAAGMMAAVSCAQKGSRVILLEKNEKLGKKLYITGKGRCNFTNACDTQQLFSAVVSNPKFLYSAFYGFSNDSVMDFFERHGMPYKVERGNRVFPVSDHSSDVIKTLQKTLRELGVCVCLHTQALSVEARDGVVCGVRIAKADQKNRGGKENSWEECSWEENGRKKNGEKEKVREEKRGKEARRKEEFLAADRVIVATGGCSYPSTGSDGDGFCWAKQLGHRISAVRPALVPLVAKEPYIMDMQGLSLKNVELSLKNKKGKILFKEFGEMLFTHFGVSGPLVLSASSIAGKVLEEERELNALIDLKPALDKKQLEERLMREFAAGANRRLSNVMRALLPAKMILPFLSLSGISEKKAIRDITREERIRLTDLLKAFPFTVCGTRGFKEAIITQGGVSVRDINPSTMESRKIKGLYFAGEILDLDALTGGYNLQIAWSTGYLAGSSIAEECEEKKQ